MDADSLTRVVLSNHPSFSSYRKELDKHAKEKEKVESKRKELYREAEDFIMLGDSESVMEFLNNLESK